MTGKGKRGDQNSPKRLPVPVSNNRNIRQPIANLERKFVEVEVRVEEVALVLAAGLEGKVRAVRLGEEELLALGRRSGDVLLLADLGARPVGALGVHDGAAVLGRSRVRVGLRVALFADPQHVDAAQQRAVQVGLIAVDVAVEARIDPPLDDTEGLVEERRQAVADRVLEVVAEDELVAADVVLGRERERDRVTVVGVLRRREVGRGRGRVCGEAWWDLVRDGGRSGGNL
jgi:hypothetical protein